MQPKRLVSLALAALLLVIVWPGCAPGKGATINDPPPTLAPAQPSYVGSVDEVIGPEGPVSPAFDDADFRQLRPPDAIEPVYDPKFVAAHESDLPDDELVIGLNINGDARAYPAGLLYHREMVNDTVGGVPVLVTWCPLCYTALVHERRVDGNRVRFGNQGALYKRAMTWFDHGTGSVWSQPFGAAIAGPLAGRSLELMPSQLTTWGQWRAAHPNSRVLVSDIPSIAYSGRRPGEDHVAGVFVGDHAIAWPYLSVLTAGSVAAKVGGTDLVVKVDPETGALRAVTADDESRELPVIIAYRWAWESLYPNGQVDKGNPIQ